MGRDDTISEDCACKTAAEAMIGGCRDIKPNQAIHTRPAGVKNHFWAPPQNRFERLETDAKYRPRLALSCLSFTCSCLDDFQAIYRINESSRRDSLPSFHMPPARSCRHHAITSSARDTGFLLTDCHRTCLKGFYAHNDASS